MHNILCDCIEMLRDGYAELRDGYAELRDGYAELRDVYAELRDVYAELRDGYAELRDGYAELRDGYAELRDAFEELSVVYEWLRDNCEVLSAAINVGNDTVEKMPSAYELLRFTNVKKSLSKKSNFEFEYFLNKLETSKLNYAS